MSARYAMNLDDDAKAGKEQEIRRKALEGRMTVNDMTIGRIKG